MGFYIFKNQILSHNCKEFKKEFSSHMEALRYLLENENKLNNELMVNLNKVAEGYKKLTEENQKEIDQLIENKNKVNWRKFANKIENYLSSYFQSVRDSFLAQFPSLEKGKLNYELSKFQDTVSPSRYAHVEKLYLYGWRFRQDREIIKGNHLMNLTKTEAKYIEYLTRNNIHLVNL